MLKTPVGVKGVHERTHELDLESPTPIGQEGVRGLETPTIFLPAVPRKILLLAGTFDHTNVMVLDRAKMVGQDIMSGSGSKVSKDDLIFVRYIIDNKQAQA